MFLRCTIIDYTIVFGLSTCIIIATIVQYIMFCLLNEKSNMLY